MHPLGATSSSRRRWIDRAAAERSCRFGAARSPSEDMPMPQLRAWHVRQKPGTLPKAGENTKALDLNPGLFRVASVHVRSLLHQSVSQREAWARTLTGIRLGILIRETKAQDRNPALSACLVGGICVSQTVSNDDRKLGSRSRRTRCRICAASAFCVCSQLPLEPGCPPQ